MTTAPDTGSSTQRAILAIGGDPRTTAQVRAAILDAGYELVGRCLDASSLLTMAADRKPDFVLLNTQLAGFSDATIHTLREYQCYPILVDETAGDAGGGSDIFGELALRLRADELVDQLPGLSETPAVRALAGGRSDAPDSAAPGAERSAAFTAPAAIVTVTSGKGSPGKTTVALGLAAALGRSFGRERVRLADFDLRGGNVAPWLGLDQSRGLVNVRLPGTDSPERAAAEIEQTRFGFLAFAGLERGAEAYRLIYEDAARCLAALAADAPSDGLVISDSASNAEPQFAIARSRVTVLVCGPDMLGSWNARGAVQTLLAEGAPLVLAVNKTRPGLERLEEIREALGLGPQASVSGGRRGVAVVGIPFDQRVDEMQRAGRIPDSGALARAFHELAFAVAYELARVDARWNASADLLAAGPPGPLRRLRRRRDEPSSLPTAEPVAPTPAAAVDSGMLPQLLARMRGGSPGAGSTLVQRLAGRIRPATTEGGGGTDAAGPAVAERAEPRQAGAEGTELRSPQPRGLRGRIRGLRGRGRGAAPVPPPVVTDAAPITHDADEAAIRPDTEALPEEPPRYEWGGPSGPPRGPGSGGADS